MDLEQIKSLTDEQKERYMALTRIFEMPGWAHIQKWAELNYEDARDRGSAAGTWEQNRIAFGERIVYDVLRKMEDITEREYTLIAEQNAAKLQEPEVDQDDLLSFEQ